MQLRVQWLQSQKWQQRLMPEFALKIKILALQKFQFRIQKLTIRHGNGVNCSYFIWFTSIPAQWSGWVKRHFSFRKQSIHLCGLLVLEHEHQFHAPLPIFSPLCFLHSKIRLHFFDDINLQMRSFIIESLLLLAFTKKMNRNQFPIVPRWNYNQ